MTSRIPACVAWPNSPHQGCRVTILADRGFGDQKLFAFLGELGFGYVIRFRGNSRVTAEDGETNPRPNGSAKADVPANCAMPG